LFVDRGQAGVEADLLRFDARTSKSVRAFFIVPAVMKLVSRRKFAYLVRLFRQKMS
jgi:hypothetical protein